MPIMCDRPRGRSDGGGGVITCSSLYCVEHPVPFNTSAVKERVGLRYSMHIYNIIRCCTPPPPPRGYREKGLYKALQKNKELIAQTLNPAPLTECEASFSRLVAMVTASMEAEGTREGGDEERSSDEETLESDETLVAEVEEMETESGQPGSSQTLRSTNETRQSGHVTSSAAEVVALGEVGVYDPMFPQLVFEAAMQVLEYLEGMQDRLATARLHVEVGIFKCNAFHIRATVGTL